MLDFNALTSGSFLERAVENVLRSTAQLTFRAKNKEALNAWGRGGGDGDGDR